MIVKEPGGLAKVRALARHLKMKPLLQLIPLRRGWVGNLPLGIVFVNQVLDNGAGFPQGDSIVRVFNSWNTKTKVSL